MADTDTVPDRSSEEAAADAFIARWQGVTASELSTSQSYLIDLCHLLGVDTPHPTAELDYMFERPIKFAHGDGSSSDGRIDLYRRGAFVLESKKLRQGAHTRGFDDSMRSPQGSLPAAHGKTDCPNSSKCWSRWVGHRNKTGRLGRLDLRYQPSSIDIDS